MKHFLLILLVVFTTMISLSAQEKNLETVILVTRHGARAPFTNIKNYKYKWSVPKEQLTPLGMRQEYKVGKKLRERYVEKLNFLNTEYESKSIHTLADHDNRTIMSAQSLLFGLYPLGTGPKTFKGKNALPKRFQPIPVYTLPETSTLLMRDYPVYQKILKKYVYNNSKILHMRNEKLKPKYKKWTTILGNKIEDLSDVLTIGDILICARIEGKGMPEKLSEKDANLIINTTKWGLAQQFKNKKVSYLMGKKFLNKIKKNLVKAKKGKTPHKLFYYSGHDLTISALASLLGRPVEKNPHFAAHYQIEMYKDKDSYKIKVRYNGEYLKLPIMKGKKYCSLDVLLKRIKELNTKFKELKI